MIKQENDTEANEATPSNENSLRLKIFNYFKSDGKEIGQLIGEDDVHNSDANNNNIKLKNISDEKKGRVKFAK